MTTHGKRKQLSKLCHCSSLMRPFDGYTSADLNTWFPDELHKMLEEHSGYPHTGHYSFNAVPHTVYSFLAEFEVDVALVLLDHGFRSTSGARELLDHCGYGWMVSDDNYSTVKTACKEGIAVDDYLDIHFNHKRTPTNNGFFEDALSFLTFCASDQYTGGIASLIAANEIRLSHVEEIGYELIGKCVDSDYLIKVLKELHDVGAQFGGPGYTTKDVRNLLTKCGNRQAMIRRLKIMDLFGFKTAFEAVHLGYLSELIGYKGQGCSPELVAYADNLFGVLKADSEKTVGDKIPLKVVSLLCEGNVPAEYAAEKLHAGEAPARIVAMSAGVHTSMTEGWL